MLISTTKVSAVKVKDVKEEFGNKIKYILDGGSVQLVSNLLLLTL